MHEVGDEIYLRDNEVTHSSVAVVLERNLEDAERTYHVFLAGIQDDRPFSTTRWVSGEDLSKEVREDTVDKEKIGLEFLAVTGNKVGQFVFYALNEMRDLLQEASDVADVGGGSEESLAETAQLLDRQVKVREYRGYDISAYNKECEIATQVC